LGKSEVEIMSIIKWLEDWYDSNCDGGWEHYYNSVKIYTIDNPGWRVKLNITETMYEDVVFNDIIIDRTDTDWLQCRKRDGNIDCAGGSKNLNEILEIIKKWMDENKS
jgi:hypothetical protein